MEKVREGVYYTNKIEEFKKLVKELCKEQKWKKNLNQTKRK